MMVESKYATMSDGEGSEEAVFGSPDEDGYCLACDDNAVATMDMLLRVTKGLADALSVPGASARLEGVTCDCLASLADEPYEAIEEIDYVAYKCACVIRELSASVLENGATNASPQAE